MNTVMNVILPAKPYYLNEYTHFQECFAFSQNYQIIHPHVFCRDIMSKILYRLVQNQSDIEIIGHSNFVNQNGNNFYENAIQNKTFQLAFLSLHYNDKELADKKKAIKELISISDEFNSLIPCKIEDVTFTKEKGISYKSLDEKYETLKGFIITLDVYYLQYFQRFSLILTILRNSYLEKKSNKILIDTFYDDRRYALKTTFNDFIFDFLYDETKYKEYLVPTTDDLKKYFAIVKYSSLGVYTMHTRIATGDSCGFINKQ